MDVITIPMLYPLDTYPHVAYIQTMNWQKSNKYDGYEASDTGLVRNSGTGYLMTPQLKKGYLSLNLSVKKKRVTAFVHRIVADAWLGASDLTVNHKNFDRTDNSISNLEYMTMGDNLQHARDAGRLCGGGASLVVVSISKETGSVSKHLGIGKASADTSCNHWCVRDVLAGKQRSTGGYFFVRERDYADWKRPKYADTTPKKPVLNTASGVTYESVAHAAASEGVSPTTMRDWLYGRTKTQKGKWCFC